MRTFRAAGPRWLLTALSGSAPVSGGASTALASSLRSARRLGRRWLLAAALLGAAAAHLPVIRTHLAEAPYMGVLFILLSTACVLLAVTVVSADAPAVYALSALTCALAIVGYAATRLVAFPELADDVGNWAEPLGVVSVACEAVALAVSVSALVVIRRPPRATGHA